MFGLLRRLRRRPRRHVFSFRLDGRTVYRDPVEVRRRLYEANPEWPSLVDAVARAARPLPEKLAAAAGDLARQRRERADQAAAELADLVATAFDAPPLDPSGRGMTAAERVGLMAAFITLCAEAGRAAGPKASSPAGTGSSPAG